MKALISPNENAFSYDGTIIGKRVAQVSETEFPVAFPLFWVDCPNDCLADLWYYDNGFFLPKPIPPKLDPIIVPEEEQTANTL